jgi:hypothetical protein
MTLGLANRGSERDEEEEVSDKLLANQSLLLILVLANHCTGPTLQSNPYRQALFSFTDSQGTGNILHLKAPVKVLIQFNGTQKPFEGHGAIVNFPTGPEYPF